MSRMEGTEEKLPGSVSAGIFAAHMSLGIALGDCLSLVVIFLSTGDSQLHFCDFLVEINSERNEGQALLRKFAEHPTDLLLMEEQLPVPFGIVIVDVALLERTDMQPDEPDFSILDDRVTVLEIGVSLAKGLDLRSLQDNAGFVAVEDEI